MRIVLPFLLLGVSRAAVQCGSIVCMHNSECVYEEPDFSDEITNPDGTPLGMHDVDSPTHCSCSPLYTGVDCSIPVDSCADGQHKC